MDVPAGVQDATTPQSLNDIQNYLATFNKEIQEGGDTNAAAFQAQGFVSNTAVTYNQTTANNQQYENFTGQGTFYANQTEPYSQTTSAGGAGDAAWPVVASNPTANQWPNTLAGSTQSNVKMDTKIEDSKPIDESGPPVLEAESFQRDGVVSQDQMAPDLRIVEHEAGGITIISPQQQMRSQDTSDAAVQVLASVASSIPQVNQAVNDTQMVAVQNSQDSSQPEIIAVQNMPQTYESNEQQQQIQVLATLPSDGGNTVQPSSDLQMVSSQADNSVVLNSGSQYQTVTIVPSEVNQGGEVSYVLIVSQPDGDEMKEGDEKHMNLDMSVYDFKEERSAATASGAAGEEEEVDQAQRKLSPKKLAHNTMSQLMCNYCNYTSPKRYLLTRHMKTHSEERPHKCNICNRGFKTIASLQNHINTHTGTRPHGCKECDSRFTTSGELVRHIRYRHSFEKPHKCTECDYASVELSKLKRHIRSHTGERPYQCPHCSYASPDTYKLKRHLRIHTGEKPYECDVCHARFTQSNSLKAHRLIHTGSKPIYQCELCPTTCGRKTDLKIHVLKLHTSDKPLQCRKCGKSFPDRYSYKLHLKTHEGEKCFKCDLCPYAALSHRHLESHVLTHTGEKPFQCDECDQSFRQKQLLRRHKNLYHTPGYFAPPARQKAHECGDCNKQFAHRGNLVRHMTLHDPECADMLRVESDGDGQVHVRVIQIVTNDMNGTTVVTENESEEVPVIELTQEELEQEDEEDEFDEEEDELPEPVTMQMHESNLGQGQASNVGKNAQQIFLQIQEGEDEQIETNEIATEEQPLNAKAARKSEDEDYDPKSSSPKGRGRGRPPGRPRKVKEIKEENVSEEVVKQVEVKAERESPNKRGRKRKTATDKPGKKGKKLRDSDAIRRAEQKKKDIEECFGFGVDEGESEGSGEETGEESEQEQQVDLHTMLELEEQNA